MREFLFLTPLIVLFLVIAGVGYVRLAPTNAAAWHIDPTDPGLRSGPGRVLVRDGGDIPSPTLAMSSEQALRQLVEIADATPRTQILAGSVEEGRVTFVTRSLLIGFPDYTTVTAIPDGDGAKLVIYGRLRFGSDDLGVNAKRVSGWLAQLPQ